jgi:uncharacterized SAM-dependent methyltransferase
MSKEPSLIVMSSHQWPPKKGHVLDLRENNLGATTEPDIFSKAWVYQADGVERWKRASFHEKYYQTREETLLLKKVASSIVSQVKPGAVIVDFGAGYKAHSFPFEN